MVRVVRRWRSSELLLTTLSPLSKFIATDATVSIDVHLIEDGLGSVEVRTSWLTVRRLRSHVEVIRGLHRNIVRFHGAVVNVQHHVRAEIFAVRLMGWRLIEVLCLILFVAGGTRLGPLPKFFSRDRTIVIGIDLVEYGLGRIEARLLGERDAAWT